MCVDHSRDSDAFESLRSLYSEFRGQFLSSIGDSHLIAPDSPDMELAIQRNIRNTVATIVVIGEQTARNPMADYEIYRTLECKNA